MEVRKDAGIGPGAVNDDVIADNDEVGDEEVDAVVVVAVALLSGTGRAIRPGRVYSQ